MPDQGEEMPSDKKRNVLADVKVREVMRVQVVSLPAASPIKRVIRRLIKYKVNALLVTDQDERPLGVVSKTDIMAGYYAGLPIDLPSEHIMMSPPLFCRATDSLESALDTMRSNRIYRLFVTDHSEDRVVGVLAYPDIVGLLYRCCRACDRSVLKRQQDDGLSGDSRRIRVRDVMTWSVKWFPEQEPLLRIMEGLSTYHFGAVLIRDSDGIPSGVISKTDLMLAYMRAIAPETAAGTVLTSRRVISCDESTFLEVALQKMVLSDLQRLFVYRGDPRNIVGVFSLSDAARSRSGSCYACVSSRIKVEAGA
jgi:CBS domain-containing protein